MSGSDLSKLHLMKKELTQIRKAGRVLRDPGTTSSWKSPLDSSRSVAVLDLPSASSRNAGSSSQFPIRGEISSTDRGKEKKVFLYNWKTQKSSSEKSGLANKNHGKGEEEEGEEASSWTQASVNDDDDVSDARNGGGDSKSDSYLGVGFRCRDTSLASQGVSKMRKSNVGCCNKKKKKSKKKTSSSRLDFLSKYHQPRDDIVSTRKCNPGSGLAVRRGDSAELSDDTEEDLSKVTGASPLLLELQHKNWSRSSSKFLTSNRKEDSSCTYNSTPALSTSSYNMYAVRNPSTVGSWDGTTTSLNDGDDELDDNLDLPGRQGCGIPCYWTKKAMKHRGGCRSCCSPSFSDTLRRTGSSILCGSQSVYRRHNRHSSGGYSKQKIASRSAQGVLPLLTYGGDGRGGSSLGTGLSDDELSTNYGELDLEAQSRLDGRRWSTSYRSQDGLEAVALDGEGEEGSTPETIRSFSQKYRPMFFEELIGQSIVVQSLMNAVKRSRIAPVYLFQGPRGTGKTSTARIFSAALNCVATEEMKPCGYCKECNDFMSGKSKYFWELDGANKKGADKVRYLLKNLPTILPRNSSMYKVFVIDECHLLPSKTWLSFLKFLENPLQKVVFIFITTDLDNVPRTIQSRCQKFLFDKLKDSDIVVRLTKIASDENLDVDLHALDLIAMNADGSLRDAETMLEQLSLLGKRITTALVNELVGVVSDEKLLELLELALTSDTAETVKRARELLDLGADPIVLMSQLASLIMDIIAGTYKVVDQKYSNAFLDGRNLTEADMEGLKHALKLLSEAEKQLRVSNDRSTWFTATLLQLGSMPSPGTTHTGSSRRQSSRATDDASSISREVMAYKQRTGGLHFSKSASPASVIRRNGNPSHEAKAFSRVIHNNCYKSSSSSEIIESEASIASHDNSIASTMMLNQRSSEKLNDIWRKCIERCHSKTLRQLLYTHGKLISISEVEGILVAYIAFGENDIKLRAERFLSSITNSIEMVLRRSVEVRIILLPETELLVAPHQTRKQEMTNKSGHLNSSIAGLNAESDAEAGSSEESRSKLPMQRIESIIREQRLETAWLQTADKDTPGSIIRVKPERNQILPQEEDTYRQQPNVGSAISSSGLTPHHWVDDLNNEVKLLRIGDNGELQENLTSKRGDNCPLSPSLLHNTNFGNNKDNLGGYESGSGRVGCNILFCWNTNKTQRRSKSKQVKGTPVRSRRNQKSRFSLFNGCAKPRKAEGNNIRR
ncbi:PREDICTED: protein STICHEL-like isoform X3 [Camelina sativa]|uniref:Protein STICHEL-like isoform X1 n=1 Tax=Camelina sativa TaxID=90675 RepID=A0ABM0ZD03_CAMSA|nr:PREDICTED: protein STICHEL-like isoform X2 [Camelina sativa]XP_010514021.1 PREDICTED: protein STICHEL-like isoform X1 [Camelina sativa]XP_010514022.1 PREDICTED: protein STICHEL-like isoform X3 [Camelina sativa]